MAYELFATPPTEKITGASPVRSSIYRESITVPTRHRKVAGFFSFVTLKIIFMNQTMNVEIRSIEEIINGAYCPIPIEVIPNNMGINLASVSTISWIEDEGQLLRVTIDFKMEK